MKKFFWGLLIASVLVPSIIVGGLLASKMVNLADLKYVGQILRDKGIVSIYYEVEGGVRSLAGDFQIPSYGREVVKGRGNTPWVMRSNLDNKIRMINFALAPNVWLSYDTQTASIYQLWQGIIDFDGAVYTGIPGTQPWSEGSAFIRNEEKTWFLDSADGPVEAKVQYLGHRFSANKNKVSFAVRLSILVNGEEQSVVIREQPEWNVEGGRNSFERAFTVEENENNLTVLLKLSAHELNLKRTLDGLEHKDDFVKIVSNAVLISTLGEPSLVIAKPVSKDEIKEPGQKLMDASDCSSCHNQSETVVGPSYDAVAQKYKDADKTKTVTALATKIIKGGSGNWGSVAMTPHSKIGRGDAEIISKFILENKSDNYEAPDETPRTTGDVSDYEVGPRLETVHPNFVVKKIRTEAFKPKVGALDRMEDDRIIVATWDTDGAVFIVDNYRGDAKEIKIKRIAEGLQEPLGIKVVDGRIFVLQKQELTELIDLDGDEVIDEYKVLNNTWGTTTNFHEFAFGLVHKDGYLYANLGICVLVGGKSCNNQLWDRGHVIRVSIETGEKENLAFGLRAPNGIALGPKQDIFITDNQGDWLPSSKLLHFKEGAFYGSRVGKMNVTEGLKAMQPIVWMPQNEIGNSPTQPSLLNVGPYKNQIIYGDIYHGGIKRVFLDQVNGLYQGALFRFSDGFEGGVNRLIPKLDQEQQTTEFFVGEIGSPGNWQDPGKNWFGLELLTYTNNETFEILEMRATPTGFHLVFSHPLSEVLQLEASDFLLQQWRYEPSFAYGGPKVDLEKLKASSFKLSDDKRSVFIDVKGLKPERVVYLRLSKKFLSYQNKTLWINEAWYTLNNIPNAQSYTPFVPAIFEQEDAAIKQRVPLNTLSDTEKAEGWKLLFNGKDLSGWRLYGEKSNATGNWIVEDDAIKLSRDRMDFLMLFSTENLMYAEDAFENFELTMDWKISENGNSGIFYGVNLEEKGTYWDEAIEMQVLDNEGHIDGHIAEHRAGDAYDLKSSSHEPVKPTGNWNTVRIIVNGDHIEHWMNGEKVVEFERSGPEWDAMLKDSKHSSKKNFGQNKRGYLLLQDHSDIVWYRNIKLKKL